MEEKLVYKSSNTVITIDESENSVIIKQRYYPLKGYGNNITWTIEFDKNEYSATVVQCNYNWDGSGCKELTRVKFGSNEFTELLDIARSIKTMDEFNNMLEKLNKIEETIDENVDNKIRELISKLQQIQQLKDILSNIDKQELVDEIKDYLLERFSDC